MNYRITPWRAATLLAFLTLLFGFSTAAVSSAAPGTGYLRLGNLSTVHTPVDIYVYPSGGTSPSGPTLSDVAYGTVQPTFQSVNAGAYTVAIRTAGSSASSQPVASVGLTVAAGQSYTVAPLQVSGEGAQRQVMTLQDPTGSLAGQAFVTVINADATHGLITFHCSCAKGAPGNIQTNAKSGTVSTAKIPAGNWTMTASGSGAEGSVPVNLVADTSRTEIVLDMGNSIQVVNLLDAVGGKPAAGGVGTGFGGTAPHGPGSPLPWLALIGGGALVALAGGLGLFRGGLRRRVSQG